MQSRVYCIDWAWLQIWSLYRLFIKTNLVVAMAQHCGCNEAVTEQFIVLSSCIIDLPVQQKIQQHSPAYKRLDIVCRLFHEDCVSSCDIEYWMVVRPCREGPAGGSEALLCVWSEKLGRESVSKSVGNGDFKAPSIVWISPDDRGLGSYIPAHHGCVSVFSTVSSVSTTSSASCRADLSVLSHSAIAPFLLFAVHYLIRGLVLNLSLQNCWRHNHE